MASEHSSSHTRIKFTPLSGTAVEFEERSITPPSITMDDAIDNTHMGSGSLRAFVPGYRGTVGDATSTVKFDPAQEDTIIALMLNKTIGTIVITYDSNATTTITGAFIKSFSPGEWSEGSTDAPTASISFGFTGYNDNGFTVLAKPTSNAFLEGEPNVD